MIALFFMNVTLLLLLGVISLMLRSSQKLVDLSSGSLVSSDLMEEFIYNDPYPSVGEIYGGIDSQGIHFEYKIDVVSVVPHVRKVNVKVFWWDSGTEIKEGYGKLYTGITTLVSEQKKP